MNKDVMFSSGDTTGSYEWETPDDLFDGLDREFNFTLDPCSTHTNAKCPNYYTTEEDGLEQPWAPHNVFMNPPYGRDIGKWVAKAYEESRLGATVVCLVPARTDTQWWHDYCLKGNVRLIRGRLKFGYSKNSAPFPSAVVIFRPPRSQDRRRPGRPRLTDSSGFEEAFCRILPRLLGGSLSIRQAARELSVSPRSVRRLLERWGLRRDREITTLETLPPGLHVLPL